MEVSNLTVLVSNFNDTMAPLIMEVRKSMKILTNMKKARDAD